MGDKSKAAIALKHVLENHKASEVATSGAVIEVNVTMSPIDAANVLWKHNILGAPVWDDAKKEYVGFFDMRDILSAVVAANKEQDDGPYLPISTKALDHMHVTLSYLAARNPFISCTADTPLAEVCRLLTEHRCHRIPILGDDGRCTTIISQSALVKFLSKNVKDPLSETLEQAGLAYKKDIVAVKDTASASEVFDTLDAHRLSGIAVVDEEDGHLVGNTSARDIKMAALDEGKTAMDKDILSYLAAVRQATPVKNERHPSAHVHEDSTVGHAVHLLAKTGYHRLFVVNEEIKPVGVISVADVIRFVVG